MSSLRDTLRRPDHKSVWRGSYKNIGYEICSWSMNLPPDMAYDFTGDCRIWNLYLYVNIDEITDPAIRESLWLTAEKSSIGDHLLYNYYGDFPLKNVDFHGGITWYSKLYDLQDHRLINIGCDYNHLHDQGMVYNLDYLLADMQRAVDSLIELLPGGSPETLPNDKPTPSAKDNDVK